MTKLRIISDTHIEFGAYTLPRMPDEKEQILILAGDIGDTHSVVHFIESLADSFANIIYVPGNHEYYYNVIEDVDSYLRHNLSHLNNVHFLQNESVTIDGINFFGSTFWTDCGGDDFHLNNLVQNGMNDFRLISWSDDELMKGSRFNVDVCKRYNSEARGALDQFVSLHRGKPNVVITHHAPGELSVHEMYEGSPLNAGFHNADCYKYCGDDISLWVHGHMHNGSDYDVNGTRVVCNPAGYPSRHGARGENEVFNDKFVVDMDIMSP